MEAANKATTAASIIVAISTTETTATAATGDIFKAKNVKLEFFGKFGGNHSKL